MENDINIFDGKLTVFFFRVLRNVRHKMSMFCGFFYMNYRSVVHFSIFPVLVVFQGNRMKEVPDSS